MSEVSTPALREITEAFARYRTAVQTASMSLAAKEAYQEYADAFIQWLHGDFDPQNVTPDGA